MKATCTPFPTTDGASIALHEWGPEDGQPVRACVVLVHGMAEHAGRYVRLASALAAAGYAVYGPDLRGHGRSAAGEGEIGHLEPGSWPAVVADVGAVVSKARADHPGTAVVLLGHSMGTIVVRDYLREHGSAVDAVVLSGVPSDPGAVALAGIGIARTESRLQGARHRSTVLDRLTFGSYNAAFQPARTHFDWLSRDTAEVDSYVEDPACGLVSTAGLYGEMLGALRRLREAGAPTHLPADLPVLLIAGDADPAGAQGSGPRRVAAEMLAAGVRDVRLRLYPGARHEPFNETNRAEVTAELLDWLADRVPDAR